MTKEDETRLFHTVQLLHDTVGDIHEKVNNHQTPWGALAGWATVLLAVVVSVGGLAMNPAWDSIAESKRDIVNLEKEQVQIKERVLILETLKSRE